MAGPSLIRGDLGESPPGFGASEGASKTQGSEPMFPRHDICDYADLPEVRHPRRLRDRWLP
jgi:hypothetical protein